MVIFLSPFVILFVYLEFCLLMAKGEGGGWEGGREEGEGGGWEEGREEGEGRCWEDRYPSPNPPGECDVCVVVCVAA